MTNPIPDSIADLTADIVITLRSGLDNPGHSLLAVLNQFGCTGQRVLLAIEAEARRLKIVP